MINGTLLRSFDNSNPFLGFGSQFILIPNRFPIQTSNEPPIYLELVAGSDPTRRLVTPLERIRTCPSVVWMSGIFVVRYTIMALVNVLFYSLVVASNAGV